MGLGRRFKHPLTRDLAVDDPLTTVRRREIIQAKPFLKAIYQEWYQKIIDHLPNSCDRVFELGSGAGFFTELLPYAFTSEVFYVDNVSLIADGCCLPFGANTLDAIVMTDVFHHIPNVEFFLNEASRCIRPGGKVLLIEPWKTSWSSIVYRFFHHEPFLPEAGWTIPRVGPLSGANGALPWIVFERDRALFKKQYPRFQIKKIELMMPISYLLSGGVSFSGSIPCSWMRIVRFVEKLPIFKKMAMFSFIEIAVI